MTGIFIIKKEKSKMNLIIFSIYYGQSMLKDISRNYKCQCCARYKHRLY